MSLFDQGVVVFVVVDEVPDDSELPVAAFELFFAEQVVVLDVEVIVLDSLRIAFHQVSDIRLEILQLMIVLRDVSGSHQDSFLIGQVLLQEGLKHIVEI